MFQKHSIMSLKKKSKSLGHLTALGSQPCSPDVEPKLKKNQSSAKLSVGEGMQGAPSPGATKYMKRFLSPTSTDRQPLAPGKETPAISSPMNFARTDKIDKQLQTRSKTTPKKLKEVMKGRSGSGGPIINAMGKALMANFTPSKNGGRNLENFADIFTSKDGSLIPNKHRAFLMDTQVKYTVGLQSQERNLFLFNDLLLIAKERSQAHYKLKDQVPLSDVWVSTCISDVSEVTLDPTTSFVIGWPINNAVLTFSSPAQKELWWLKLSELIRVERSHSPAGASINVTYFDNATNFEHLKSIYVSIGDSSRDCISKALECLEISDSPAPNPADFQLWVKTKLEESPYPLIGHEVPLVIKLHWMRQTFNNKNQKTYDEYRQGCRCSFILRKVGQVAALTPDTGPGQAQSQGSQKKKLKKVKSSIKLQNVFRRVSQGSKGSEAAEPGSPDTDKKLGQLFGRAVEDLCGPAEQLPSLPPCVAAMLGQLRDQGPATVGIFRRGPNVRAMRDLRDKLDEGEAVDWAEISVFVTAALVKDLLRSLPDCLLTCDNYSAWTEAATAFHADNKLETIKSHVERLPRANNYLLHHLLFILNKVAENHEENKMTASNLSICVGPSLMWTHDQAYMMDQSYSKEVSTTVQILIDQFPALYGEDPPPLFREGGGVATPAPAEDTAPPVGGAGVGPLPAERTSSLSSTKSENGTGKQKISKKGSMFDHSSLDSLLDPAYPEDDLARQSGTEAGGGVSLTNLSHDSGLTTSDSQLYAFEAEENSFSSDDFCIETITGKENTVHAIVNKKFLSRYGGSYLPDYPLPGQVPDHHHHHHGQGQGVSSPSRRKVQQRNAKNRDRMHRRIHRNNDYGSNSGYNSNGGGREQQQHRDHQQAAYNYNVRSNSSGGSFPLRRTASEESVTVARPGGGQFEIIAVNNNNRSGGGGHRSKRPGHRKGKAPNPPHARSGRGSSPSIVRSNSVNQVRHWDAGLDWYRSKSTTRLHSEDSEADTVSTLSDEDSTPHVSRSNSYGRSEDNGGQVSGGGGGGGYTVAHQDDTTYDIYLHDERHLELGTNLETAFINNARRRQGDNRDRREFDSFSCETPPGYEESLYRQRILKLHNRSSYMSPSPVRESSSSQLSDKAIEKQSELSAKAKAVFEESLRQYENTKGGAKDQQPHPPPPLPPKTERPPLPPKQRGARRSTEPADSGGSSSEADTGSSVYVNTADIAAAAQHQQQLRHRAPARTRMAVSASPVTVARYEPADSGGGAADTEAPQFVYGSYYSGSGGTRVSVTTEAVTCTAGPPQLPPKELRLAEVSETRSQVKKKVVSSTRIVGTTSKPSMKSVETQTDENEFYFYEGYDGYKVEEDGFNHTDSEYSPESGRSVSPDYAAAPAPSTAQYYRDTKVPDHYYLGGGPALYSAQAGATTPSPAAVSAAVPAAAMYERPVSASPALSAAMSRQAGRRKLEPVQSVPVSRGGGGGVAGAGQDPVISGEINWSVSQLRSLFNQGLERSGSPLYRAKQQLEARPRYPGDMAGYCVNMYSADTGHTDSDQESYV